MQDEDVMNRLATNLHDSMTSTTRIRSSISDSTTTNQRIRRQQERQMRQSARRNSTRGAGGHSGSSKSHQQQQQQQQLLSSSRSDETRNFTATSSSGGRLPKSTSSSTSYSSNRSNRKSSRQRTSEHRRGSRRNKTDNVDMESSQNNDETTRTILEDEEVEDDDNANNKNSDVFVDETHDEDLQYFNTMYMTPSHSRNIGTRTSNSSSSSNNRLLDKVRHMTAKSEPGFITSTRRSSNHRTMEEDSSSGHHSMGSSSKGRRRSSLVEHVQFLVSNHHSFSNHSEEQEDIVDLEVDSERSLQKVNRHSGSWKSQQTRGFLPDRHAEHVIGIEYATTKRRAAVPWTSWTSFYSTTGGNGSIVGGPPKKEGISRTFVLFGVLICFGLIAVTLTPIVMKLRGKHDNQTFSTAQVPQTSRADAMEFWIRDRFVTSTPEGDISSEAATKALIWISDDDPLQLSIPGFSSDGSGGYNAADTVTSSALPALLQRYGLAVFYFAQEQAASKNEGQQQPNRERRLQDDWKTSATPTCEWAGVTCDADELVTALNFTSGNWRGSIPAELWSGGAFPRMTSLDLGNNLLIGTLPHMKSSINQTNTTTSTARNVPVPPLEELFLNNNDLEGSIENLVGLYDLKVLDVSDNRLNGTIHDELKDFEKLGM